MNPNTYMTTNEDRVVITIEEYVDLIRDSQTLESLVQTLLEKAELSWDKKALRFDDSSTCHVLSALCRNRYHGRLFTLQAEKEREEKRDGENN